MADMEMYVNPRDTYAQQCNLNDDIYNGQFPGWVQDGPVDSFTPEHCLDAACFCGHRTSTSTMGYRPQMARSKTQPVTPVPVPIGPHSSPPPQMLLQQGSNASSPMPSHNVTFDVAKGQLDMERELQKHKYNMTQEVLGLQTKLQDLRRDLLPIEQRLASVETQLGTVYVAFRPLAGDSDSVADGVKSLVTKIHESSAGWDRRMEALNELAEVVKVLADITEPLRKGPEQQETLQNWSRRYDSTTEES